MGAKNIWTVILTVLIITANAMPICAQSSSARQIPEDSWYFRWSDVPANDQGIPIGDYEVGINSEWKSVADSREFRENPKRHKIVWLHTRLPAGYWQQPSLTMIGVSQNFEAYFNEQMIYKAAEFRPPDHRIYAAAKSYFISLGNHTEESALLLKVYSEDGRPQEILRNTIWLGSQTAAIRKIIGHGVETFILGSIFMSVGIFSILIYLRRKSQKNYPILSFGIFVGCMGMSYLGISPITELLVRSGFIRHYWAWTGFLFFPVGLYMFLEQISGQKDMFVHRLWQLHIIAAIMFLLLDVTNLLTMSKTSFIFGLMLLSGISIGLIRLGKRNFLPGVESKALNIGTIALISAGLHDTLVGFRLIPAWHAIFPWGVFAFIICLGYILESRFTQSQQRLKIYSAELETKSEELRESNEKLEEYSQTLEQKVEERTQQLRETQDQLIMREKMASLGNLVAGIAHEMNNPIGAIHSAADVANRSIRKLKALLQSDQYQYDDSKLQRPLMVLDSNHQVITAASKRIARIIESLKAFSRLDEAKYQRIDIHESIDTALNLLQHELKDKVIIVKKYGKLPLIQGYSGELNQVFMNLLTNAIQAIRDRGTINVVTTADESNATIEISDTGVGIPSGVLPRIFDPGFTDKGIGIGLGLSIVYNTIKKHQGDINVRSKIGEGTQVTIVLPIN